MGRGRRLHKGSGAAAGRRLAVRLAADQGWDVYDPATGAACSNHTYEAQAVTWARQVLERAGGGQLLVESSSGRRELRI